MDFDTSKNNKNGRRGERRPSRGGGFPDFSTGSGVRPENPSRRHRRLRRGEAAVEQEAGDFRIPAGARKAALVHLALAAWHKGLLDPKELGEVRG